MKSKMKQLELFDIVCEAFAESPDRLSTLQLYQAAKRKRIDIESRVPIGAKATPRNVQTRAIRWVQQTLKKLGLAAPIVGERGLWQLTPRGKEKLTRAQRGTLLVAYSSDLGIALWGHHEDVFSRLDEPITLCLTSPPYALARPRAYGGPSLTEYVDFVCVAIEPIVRSLRAGGSIALNISNDIFERGTPARSLYRERLAIALYERLGLHKMDELVWENPCKPPGPTYWSSIHRFHLTATWEPVLWFTNDPLHCIADNRRVLQPHTEAQQRLMERGGARRRANYGDGAYKLREHSYGTATTGRIPRNVLRFAHNCPDKQRTKAIASTHGLPTHGATMPLTLAEFLVRYLSDVGDLVVDPFSGWGTTAVASERNQRRWITTEVFGEYAMARALRLKPRETPGP